MALCTALPNAIPCVLNSKASSAQCLHRVQLLQSPAQSGWSICRLHGVGKGIWSLRVLFSPLIWSHILNHFLALPLCVPEHIIYGSQFPPLNSEGLWDTCGLQGPLSPFVICETSQGEAHSLVSNTDRKIQKVKKGEVTMWQSCREISKKRLDLRRTKAGWRSEGWGWGASPQVVPVEDILTGAGL